MSLSYQNRKDKHRLHVLPTLGQKDHCAWHALP